MRTRLNQRHPRPLSRRCNSRHHSGSRCAINHNVVRLICGSAPHSTCKHRSQPRRRFFQKYPPLHKPSPHPRKRPEIKYGSKRTNSKDDCGCGNRCLPAHVNRRSMNACDIRFQPPSSDAYHRLAMPGLLNWRCNLRTREERTCPGKTGGALRRRGKAKHHARRRRHPKEALPCLTDGCSLLPS